MQERYDITIRLLHWTIAALIFTLIGLGMWMTELPNSDPNKLSYILLHKSLGVTALILVIGRIAMRILTSAPALPDTIAPSERKLAHLGHVALYVLMVAVPLSGYVLSMTSKYGIEWFGVELYNYIGVNEELHEIAEEAHEVLPYILLALVVIHVAGVIKHKRFDKPATNLLPRISLCRK
jgi:cytochrome b561